MKAKILFVLPMLILFLFFLQLPAQQSNPAAGRKGQAIYIAPQVAAVMDADAGLRKNRSDIPLTYLQTLHLPAQQNQVYPIFLFQIKNVDLNFSAPQETPDRLKANYFVFLRVYRMENGAAGEIVKEHFIHFDLEEPRQGFQPEALNFYSVAGEIFPAGTYLLALALSTPDFSKISTRYVEFTLPDFSAVKDKLVTTPVFSVRSMQMLPAADSKLVVHKNSFVYNTLLLEPSLNNEFKFSENLDLFYFILGSKADSTTNAVNLQITYIFKKDGKEIHKLTPQTVNNYIISQPIGFTFTEITRDAKGIETERKEKLLESGDYVLEIEILDLISKATGRQEFRLKIVQ